MVFEPDILVTTPDEPRAALVVEAKLHIRNFSQTEAQLKDYMVGMQCPVGLVVTPEELWIYHDSYTDRSPDSVRQVGKYNSKLLWREPPPTHPAQFEAFVQRWLEDLASMPAQEIPKDLRHALREYILPAVTTGEVRAAHPRYF